MKRLLSITLRYRPSRHRFLPHRTYFSSFLTLRTSDINGRVQFSSSTPSTSEFVREAAKYARKSPTEHVLLRPDTYIGGVGMRENETAWLFDSEKQVMYSRNVTYPPGLLKIFDEILVNAADNKARDPKTMNEIRVDIDRKNDTISIWNNGRGLPVELHPTEKIYVPTLVFGSLFTSSNYDDQEVKIVGGRNGYGAKLCNIFSKEFTVETRDSQRKLHFRQRWHENMQKFDEPEVNPEVTKLADFTKVTFRPDLKRFGLKTLTDDVIDLLKRRVVDVAATLPNDVKVFLNGEKIQIRGFREYVQAFSGASASDILFRNPSSRWNVAVSMRNADSNLPGAVSFVNNVATTKGGIHVDYVMDRLIEILKPAIDEKINNPSKNDTGKKTGVKPLMIKSNLSLFVNCFIENPSFDSQTKEVLTTKSKNFGSSFEFDRKELLTWANRSGFVDSIIDQLKNRKITQKSVKSKPESLSDIVKLEDAEWAGNSDAKKSSQCTLLVTEGDSAKALALSGLEVLGREKFGVFPLRGKVVNVSQLDEAKVRENAEINNLMRILGLRFEENYESAASRESLRYGKLMILADQDEDGSHIKGLIINFIHKFWPKLLATEFICAFRTPLLKAKRANETIPFYSLRDFRKWQENLNEKEARKYTIKYYKGLGTSTAVEARQYFSNLDHHVVNYNKADEDDEASIRMAFDREKAEERRRWIESVPATSSEDLPSDGSSMSFKDFVDGEMMRFGLLDLQRSIPSVVDGLKPSQRKVLYTLLKRDSDKEIKVSQLAGAVAHSQAYHHGEEALVNTIVRMAQNFCGANNLALLEPIGQFGTRHEGGHDAASARYIFTNLSPLARILFPAEDDLLLERLQDDGQLVEPKWLCPILPLVLINGAEGIGTGWATKIANRNVQNVCDAVKMMIEKADRADVGDLLLPHYEGFTGQIQKLDSRRYFSTGKAEFAKTSRKNDLCVNITELPVGVWTSKYKEKLNTFLKDGLIGGFSESHTEKSVRFSVEMLGKATRNLDLQRFFKLQSTFTEHLVLFNAEGVLKRYPNVLEIATEHFVTRKGLYEKRRELLLRESSAKLKYLENQARFVENLVNGSLKVTGRKREEVEIQMKQFGFETNPVKILKKQLPIDQLDFAYLLEMPMSRLTKEEIEKLDEKAQKQRKERDSLDKSQWQQTWTTEIEKFEKFSRF